MIEDHKIIKQQNAKQITEIESKLKTPGIDSKEEKRLVNSRNAKFERHIRKD